ncbi:MAG: hypothetical protein KH138_13115 [Firmicutes bacterium]|nr:hypothetical protein [Bacillota bacterium]
MDNYAEMVARHKMEMDALPLGFAFDQEEFRAMMESWGLDSIGITMDEVQSDPRLQAGYQKAVKQISERME